MILGKELNDFSRRFGSGSHQYDHSIREGMSKIVEKLISPSRQASKGIHRPLNDVRACRIERIYGLPRLEVHIRVHRGTSHERIVWIEPSPSMCDDEIVVDHGSDLVVREQLDLVDFM